VPPGLKRPRGRILFAIIALLLVVGTAPLVFTSYSLVTRSHEILELDQKTIQLDKARSLAAQVSIYVGSLADQVEAIARTLEAVTPPGQFPDRVAKIRDSKGLERYVGDRINYVTVADASGAGARSGILLSEPTVQRFLDEGFQRGLQGTPMISHPVFSAALHEPVLVLGAPVRPGSTGTDAPEAVNTRVEGVVLVVASLGPLWTMTRDTAEAGVMDVYVVDARGHLVAHSDAEQFTGDRDLSDLEIVKQFQVSRGKAGATVPFAITGEDGQRREMLGTYIRVPDESGWGVIVQIPQEKAFFSAIEMRNQSAKIVAGVTLTAILLGMLFARQITSPIQLLAAGARQLAAGDYTTRVNVRSSNEVGFLAGTFNHMSEEIQKAIEEIRQAAATNKELFMGSIRMLANAIDEKDPYTRGHSERVAWYSMVMAKHMGMTPEEVENVHLSGIIHDVGKIGIEDKILRKPAALTEEEYEIMKQHPTKGAHILEAVPLLKEMAGPGLMHHENVDGSGYPMGLKGDDIPLLGRIVSVADAFDAMTTDRPYSKAMTFEDALKRLRFLAGKKFDSGCVDAIEKAAASGDLTQAKARRASVAARQPAPGAAPEQPVPAPTA
jgi:HD-GYP domain-containing protein (c-di-GMP phosphodiesterase class II)